jgi:ATP-dependent RNA helicase RhlE
MQFADLRLSEPLLRAVRTAGYKSPTPIQSEAIPIVLAGRDVLGCAQTGTGKTAAFALPILQRLNETAAVPREPSRAGHARTGRRDPKSRTSDGQRGGAWPGQVRALVLCPTRELAQQISDSFDTYGAHSGIRTAVIFGGVNQNRQVRAVQAGADVVVATPGRLLDLIGQGLVSLADVEILVLDEADRMLDMGFLPDIRRILGEIPEQRQSLLFSATMPAPIRALAGDMLRDPVPIQVARVSSPSATVEHWVYHVEQSLKPSLLVHLLRGANGDRALVFTRTKRGADKVAQQLVKAGVRAEALHGNKSQGARTRALDGFRSAETPVLVATDIAARGLDVDDIAQVINYDLTPDPETYVHRIGRTGRAGAWGVAVSFCTNEQRGDLRAIERLLCAELQHAPVPKLGGHACGRTGEPTKAAPATHGARPRQQPRSGRTSQRHPIQKGARSPGRRRGGGPKRPAASAK